MEITLEKIELVKDRTGVGYKEAKEALEQTEGSVVDAIILIEETIDEDSKEAEKKNLQIMDAIKEAVHKGNVNKIVIKKNDEVVMSLPVNIGIIGTVLFPWAAIAGCIAALGTKCGVELVKDGGEVVNVSEKASKTFEIVKDKSGVLYDEMKGKGGDLFETAKDKGSDLFETAKDKGSDLFETAKDKGGDLYEAARGKSEDLYESARDRFSKEMDDDVPEEEPARKPNDFDLSDLDLDEMGEE